VKREVTSKIAEVTARCRKIGAPASRSIGAFPPSGHQVPDFNGEPPEAAMNDERCIIQQSKDGHLDRRRAVVGSSWGSWKNDGGL
jgi:hypothetical protein